MRQATRTAKCKIIELTIVQTTVYGLTADGFCVHQRATFTSPSYASRLASPHVPKSTVK
jgi:hypothetical protein